MSSLSAGIDIVSELTWNLEPGIWTHITDAKTIDDMLDVTWRAKSRSGLLFDDCNIYVKEEKNSPNEIIEPNKVYLSCMKKCVLHSGKIAQAIPRYENESPIRVEHICLKNIEFIISGNKRLIGPKHPKLSSDEYAELDAPLMPAVGIIDPDYTGNIAFLIRLPGVQKEKSLNELKIYDKARFIVWKRRSRNITKEIRGIKGFGSSGKPLVVPL